MRLVVASSAKATFSPTVAALTKTAAGSSPSRHSPTSTARTAPVAISARGLHRVRRDAQRAGDVVGRAERQDRRARRRAGDGVERRGTDRAVAAGGDHQRQVAGRRHRAAGQAAADVGDVDRSTTVHAARSSARSAASSPSADPEPALASSTARRGRGDVAGRRDSA